MSTVLNLSSTKTPQEDRNTEKKMATAGSEGTVF